MDCIRTQYIQLALELLVFFFIFVLKRRIRNTAASVDMSTLFVLLARIEVVKGTRILLNITLLPVSKYSE